MKKKRIFAGSKGIIIFLPIWVGSIALGSEVPASLLRTIQSYREMSAKTDENSQAVHSLVDQIYTWIREASRQRSLGSVIEDLSRVIPVRQGEETWKWEDRVSFRSSPQEPFSISVALWNGGDREVMIVTAIYVVTDSSGWNSVQSVWPILITKRRGSIHGQSFPSSSQAQDYLGILGCVAFVEPRSGKSEEPLPDVIIMGSSGGRTEGLQLWQLHDTSVRERPDWHVLWKEEWIFVQEVEYQPTVSKLSVLWRDGTAPAMPSQRWESIIGFEHGRVPTEQIRPCCTSFRKQ